MVNTKLLKLGSIIFVRFHINWAFHFQSQTQLFLTLKSLTPLKIDGRKEHRKVVERLLEFKIFMCVGFGSY